MKRLLIQTFLLSGLLSVAAYRTHAQAAPTASRSGNIQVGAGWTFAKPDYGQRNIQGISIYGTFDLTRHFGIEGDIHRTSLITPTDIGEDSYLLGPRYVFHHNRFNPYAKALFGLSRFKYQYDNAPHTAYTYGTYAFGGGLDYAATRHLNVRVVDFEYQKWPSFPTSGLSPLVFTFGAAYAFR